MTVSLLIAIAMMLIWSLVYGEFSLGQSLLGFAFGVAFVLVTGAGRGRIIPLSQAPTRLFYLSAYILVLIPYDIVRSNLDMARRIVRVRPDIHPGIVRVQLGIMSRATAGLVGHAITMTPGQIVVDYSDDGRTIYVHLLDVAAAEAEETSLWHLYHGILRRVFE